MGLSKPVIITSSAVDTSNLATKSDMTTLQNSVTSALSGVGGAVKHIQRGNFLFTVGKGSSEISLSGFSNLSKMAVLVNGDVKHASSSSYYSEPYISNLTLTKLTITNGFGAESSVSSDTNRYLSYQVIEFK